MRKTYIIPQVSVCHLSGMRPLLDVSDGVSNLNDAPPASENGNPPMDAKQNPYRYDVWEDDWREEEER